MTTHKSTSCTKRLTCKRLMIVSSFWTWCRLFWETTDRCETHTWKLFTKAVNRVLVCFNSMRALLCMVKMPRETQWTYTLRIGSSTTYSSKEIKLMSISFSSWGLQTTCLVFALTSVSSHSFSALLKTKSLKSSFATSTRISWAWLRTLCKPYTKVMMRQPGRCSRSWFLHSRKKTESTLSKLWK